MKWLPKLSQCRQSKLKEARPTRHTRRSEKARLVEETRQHATKTRRDGLATHISHDMRCQGEFPTWTPPYLPGESPLAGVRRFCSPRDAPRRPETPRDATRRPDETRRDATRRHETPRDTSRRLRDAILTLIFMILT